MNQLIAVVQNSWQWCGLSPKSVYRENDFGNLIVEDTEGKYWRITPEELRCSIVAEDLASLVELERDNDFIVDWDMKVLIEIASEKLGVLPPGRKYCLKLPGVLGGKYVADNLGTITLLELIAFAGDMAYQIKDIPDGKQVQLEIK